MENTTGIRTLQVGIKESHIMGMMGLAAQAKVVYQNAVSIMKLEG